MPTRYGVSPWIDTFPARKRPAFPPFRGTITAPLVIVGGGMTGTMTAYACAAAGLKVLLIEAGRIGAGGSGHASGVHASEASDSFRDFEARAGRRIARAHFDFTRRAALDLVAAIKRLDIKAGLEAVDGLRVVPPGWSPKLLQREVEERRGAGLEAMWQKAPAVARAALVESEGGARLPAWGYCNPFRLTLGFARAAVDRGAAIFERTEVRRITFDRRRATVETATGRITAERVLLCTGEPTDLAKALKRHVRFEERGVVLTEPLPGAVRKQVGLSAAIVTDTESPPHQLRWTDDNRVVIAGADGRRTPERRRPKVLVQRTGQLMYELTRLYPAISGVPPAYGWLLPLAHASDGGLYVGPHRNLPHQLFAFGTSHDPARAFLASRVLLRHVLGEATSDDEQLGFARSL